MTAEVMLQMGMRMVTMSHEPSALLMVSGGITFVGVSMAEASLVFGRNVCGKALVCLKVCGFSLKV
jgi:hypothetical protein